MGNAASSYYSARMCCLRCHTEFKFKNRTAHQESCRPGHISRGVRNRQPARRYRAQVRDLWAKGAAIETIARTVKRSTRSVKAVIAELPAQERERAALLTTPQAARALGLSVPILNALVRRGVLRAHRVPAPHRRRGPTRTFRRFARADVIRFVHDRRYWPLVAPGMMGDPVYRTVAETLRRNAGGRWLTMSEIANLACVAPSTASERVQGGWLDGLEQTTWGTDRWWWLPTGASLPVLPDGYIARLRRQRRRKEQAA